MDFDSVFQNIVEELLEDNEVKIEEYCQNYPEYKEKLLAKLSVMNFLKKSLCSEDPGRNREIGEYVILQELSRVKTGAVLLAIQPLLSRLAVIKLLLPEFAMDKENLRSFQEKTKVMAKFDHPNIMPIYSFGEEKGIQYIAMGYIPGVPLEDTLTILRRRKSDEKSTAKIVQEVIQTFALRKDNSKNNQGVPMERNASFWNKSYYEFVAAIGAEIAGAVGYAHQNNIFHGDIRPANILLASDAIPIVEEFNLGKDMQQASPAELPGPVSALAYTAPERFRENSINAETDIWSLGTTLYELLTFSLPFKGNSPQELIEKIVTSSPFPLRYYDRKIPADLEAVVMKCLENRHENRYHSASELAGDLNNYLQAKPITAKPEGLLVRAGKLIKRNPLATIWILVSFFFGTAGGFLLVNKRINDIIEEGLFFIDYARYPEAIRNYTQALRLLQYTPFKEQRQKEVLKDLARGWRGKGNFQEAIRCLKEAIRIDPHYAAAFAYLGDTYLEKGLYDKAIGCYKSAIAFAPDDRENYLYLGETLTKKGLLDEAIESYRQAVTIAPEDTGSFKEIASILREKELILPEQIRAYLTARGFTALQIQTVFTILSESAPD